MMESIEIMLIPSLLSTIKNMGIDQDEYDEDVDCDAICYHQGYDIDSMEIAPGERFTIDGKWEKAVFDCNGDIYILIMKFPWANVKLKNLMTKFIFAEANINSMKTVNPLSF